MEFIKYNTWTHSPNYTNLSKYLVLISAVEITISAVAKKKVIKKKPWPCQCGLRQHGQHQIRLPYFNKISQ
jgi:hypothetical protein